MSHTIAQHRNANPMWVYEHNFALLTKLVDGLAERDPARTLFYGDGGRLQVRVMEHHKYTALVQVHYSLGPDSGLVPDLEMTVRIYYDARLAEVIAYQGLRRILAEYPYPNDRMLYRDEKRQANHLLYELLESLLAQQQRRSSPTRA